MVHRVCQDKSIRLGVFTFMNLLPRTTLSAKEIETQERVITESTAQLQELDAKLIHEGRMTFSTNNGLLVAQSYPRLRDSFV